MAERLRRHDLAYVDPMAWARLLATRPDLRSIDLVAGWADAGRPLVARRRGPGDLAGLLALGLPLPPALGKQRIAVSLPAVAVASTERFPALRGIAGAAPAAWHATIDALLGLAADVGLEPLVFGSLAWSVLTGLDYLSAASDLDLLWPVTGRDNTSALLVGLALVAAGAPMRIDGEILDPEGSGIDWRELASGRSEVLVKEIASVRLIRPADFLRVEEPA